MTEAPNNPPEGAAVEPRPPHLHVVHTPPEGLNVGHVEANPETVESTETPINPPEAPEPKARRRAADLPPILPAWAASRAALTSTTREAAKYYGHVGAHRGLRLVPDLLRWSWWGIAGAALVVARLTKWVADLDGHPLLGDVTAQTDRAYVVMADKRSARQKARAVAVASLAVLVLSVAIVLHFWAPRWVGIIVALGVMVALIRYGKPADKRLLSGPTVPKAAAPRLTDVSISQAFGALGLPPLRELVVKGNTAALFAGPIERTKNGTGYRVEMTMPLGVTAAEIAACRAKLAGNLRRQIGQVWPLEQRGKHEAALELLVLDKPFSQMKLPAWPLLGSGKGDLLGAIPFGWSATGERITLTLFENNALIGAAPGQGKSGAVLVIACTGALDPRAELHLHELKGTNDMAGLACVAHRFTTGPAREEDLASVMASIREVHAQLETRALALAKAQEKGLAPERKVTPALASDPRLGLHPLLLVIDEVQELMNSDYRDEAEDLLTTILKRGRALGIETVLATQNPDKKSLPKAADRLIMVRFALRLLDQIGNDQTLGTSSYQAGYRATQFDESDKGIGLLKRGGSNVVTVRTNYLTASQVDSIGRRARVLREQSGRLTGDAIGDTRSTSIEDAAARSAVLVDVLDLWTAAEGDDTAWIGSLEDVLADRMPDRYGDLTTGWLGPRLRSLNVPTLSQRKRNTADGQVNRAGVSKAAIITALERTE